LVTKRTIIISENPKKNHAKKELFNAFNTIIGYLQDLSVIILIRFLCDFMLSRDTLFVSRINRNPISFSTCVQGINITILPSRIAFSD
jgi:hypothetical protein